MIRYEVRALVNVGDGNFFGYQPLHPMAEVTSIDGEVLEFEVDAVDPLHAAAWMWVIGNKQGTDNNGREWPLDIRSLSVGDMVTVRDSLTRIQTTLTVEPIGFGELSEPANPIVPIEETRHTSRGRA